MPPETKENLNLLHRSHPRDWGEHRYVYAVMSRRSRGLSIGINLNPDKACNFDCIYCQVDRTTPPTVRRVELEVLERELESMLAAVADETIWHIPPFDNVPRKLQRLNDVAFSGDGEPTSSPIFLEAAKGVVSLLQAREMKSVKTAVLTDAAYLTRPNVIQGMDTLAGHNLEIWAKLDAGTEAYFQLVDRPSHSLEHVVENITFAARRWGVVIQSLFMKVDGVPPDHSEISAYLERLRTFQSEGGSIRYVQIYTIARTPAESYVTPLTPAEVDAIRDRVRQETGLQADSFYAPE